MGGCYVPAILEVYKPELVFGSRFSEETGKKKVYDLIRTVGSYITFPFVFSFTSQNPESEDSLKGIIRRPRKET